MDLNEFAIGALHFDDLSTANEDVYAHAPEDCTMKRAHLVNGAVAITGGTDTVTFRRGTVPLAMTIAATGAAEGQFAAEQSVFDAQNRFQLGERISALTDGGASSVNQADLTLTMRRIGVENMRLSDFALVAYFDDTSAVEVSYLPIPCGCRIKRIQASNVSSVTTAGVITVRRNNDTAMAATLPLNDQAGAVATLDGSKLFAEATNQFREGDRLELSTAGGTTGASEAYVTVTFERIESDVDLKHFFLTAQFDQGIASSEVAYVPVPFACRLAKVLLLTHTTHAVAATITARKGGISLGTFTTSLATETIATFIPASSETLETGDGDDTFVPGSRLELESAGGTGTSELTAVAIFRRLD